MAAVRVGNLVRYTNDAKVMTDGARRTTYRVVQVLPGQVVMQGVTGPYAGKRLACVGRRDLPLVIVK